MVLGIASTKRYAQSCWGGGNPASGTLRSLAIEGVSFADVLPFLCFTKKLHLISILGGVLLLLGNKGGIKSGEFDLCIRFRCL